MDLPFQRFRIQYIKFKKIPCPKTFLRQFVLINNMFYVEKVGSLAGTGSGKIIPEPTIRKGSGSTKRQSL